MLRGYSDHLRLPPEGAGEPGGGPADGSGRLEASERRATFIRWVPLLLLPKTMSQACPSQVIITT